MPDIQTVQCPGCGANLSAEGSPGTSFACPFCGAAVVVPGQAPQPPAPRPANGPSPSELPLKKLSHLKHLVRSGKKAEAVQLYRQLYGGKLHEAQSAVEKLAAGGPLELPATLTAPTAPPAPAASDNQMDTVAALAKADQKIEAIKLYRALTGARLQEAKEAVEKLEAGQPPKARYSPARPSSARPAGARPASAQRPGIGGRLGRWGCVSAAVIGIAAFIIFMNNPYWLLARSGSYAQALDAARRDPAVVQALGAPISPLSWPGKGYVYCHQGKCDAYYPIQISGSRRSGRIDVRSTSTGAGVWNDGVWTLKATVVVEGGDSFLLPPAPTLSSAQVEMTQMAQAHATATTVAEATARANATRAAAASATAEVQQATAAAAAEATQEMVAKTQDAITVQAMAATQSAWPAAAKIDPAAPFQGWPTGTVQDEYIALTMTVQAGQYLWRVGPKREYSYWVIDPEAGATLYDLYARVDVQFGQGDAGSSFAYGLTFRHQAETYGLCAIERRGYYLVEETHNSMIYSSEEEPSSAILTQPGTVNHLAVRASGTEVYCQVNGVLLAHLTMSKKNLPEGLTGLGVQVTDMGDPAEVQFSNFAVYAPGP